MGRLWPRWLSWAVSFLASLGGLAGGLGRVGLEQNPQQDAGRCRG